MELMDGDMDLSGDPQQEVSRELLRLKKKQSIIRINN